MILQGDCLIKLKELADNSVDSIVTDPPYHLVSIVKRFGKENSAPAREGKDGSFKRLSGGFMGKTWDGLGEDGIGIANNPIMWKECLRVLKPGGYLLSFGGTRTYHRMACAIEDAGFEVRDMIEWVYGSGFPKSLNIGKAVDKLQGNKREISGYEERFGREGRKANCGFKEEYVGASGTQDQSAMKPIMLPVSEEAKQWESWGTALKPSHEPICMARKPLSEKTVAENCLKWGTGGINIDSCRVGTESESDLKELNRGNKRPKGDGYSENTAFKIQCEDREEKTAIGRFPANIIHDGSEEVRECFPESNSGKGKASTYEKFGGQWGKGKQIRNEDYGDSGNASRFFKSIPSEEKNCRVVINCALCGKPKSIRASTKRERNYCSLDCARKGHSKFSSQNVDCAYCGTEFIKKNSQMFTDKHFCSRECMGEWQSKFLLGENSYNWKDGKMDLISRVRSLKKMIDWRNEVYKRDGYTCQKCGDNTGGNLEAHHKKHLSDLIRELNLVDITDAIESKELWDIDNGITLCDDCHIETHKTESKKSVLYFAKASKSERNRGCEGLEEKEEVYPGINTFDGDGNRLRADGSIIPPLKSKNNHPTVKPIALMEYLIKMVTPKGGVVLDPFAGSGSTLVAAKKNGYQYIGIEMTAEYIPIIEARLKAIKEELKLIK